MTTPNDPTRAPTRPLTREDLDAIPPSSPAMPSAGDAPGPIDRRWCRYDLKAAPFCSHPDMGSCSCKSCFVPGPGPHPSWAEEAQPATSARPADAGPTVRLVKLWLCDACLQGEGEECHTPGCALYLHTPPGHPIMPELYEVVSPDSPPTPDPRLQAALTRAFVAEGQAKELREEVARLRAASEGWVECASGHDPCLFRPADGCPACWALGEAYRARNRALWRSL